MSRSPPPFKPASSTVHAPIRFVIMRRCPGEPAVLKFRQAARAALKTT